ncbi:ABC transporter permease [Bacillus spongiae]|uniref:ABC transporter permease n=1 Tax=Bacillus spongiae TaxID=2683610 RepID=A0ABU8H8Z9_9BACI
MLNLIRNEWMKIFKRPGTYVMIGLLVLFVVAMGGIYKYVEKDIPENLDWKQQLTTEIESDKQTLEEYGNQMMDIEKLSYEKDIAINTYRIENDLPENQGNSVWSFVEEASTGVNLVGLFAIIVAAGIVASEFSWGTIKLLLIRPISRFKILLSKYITVLLFGSMLLVILFALSALVGVVLFGGGSDVYLSYVEGEVIKESTIWFLMKQYLLGTIGVFMITTMAFMISTLFKNSSIAIGISIFTLLVGGTVTAILAVWFDWAKYILFANTDLTMYSQGILLREGMTLEFSLIVLAVYYIIFMLLAFIPFMKRDMGA